MNINEPKSDILKALTETLGAEDFTVRELRLQDFQLAKLREVMRNVKINPDNLPEDAIQFFQTEDDQ